jgi:hypothetical protein
MKTNAAIEESETKEVPLDAGVDKLTKGGGEVTTVGIGVEHLDAMNNVDRPHIASTSCASTATLLPDAPTKTQ